MQGGNIRFIRKLDSSGFVWEEQDLTGRIRSLAVLLMDREDSSGIEVAETSTAPEEGVVSREVGQESAEVLYPSVMVVPEQEIDHLLMTLL